MLQGDLDGEHGNEGPFFVEAEWTLPTRATILQHKENLALPLI